MTQRLAWEQARTLIEQHTGPVTTARPVSDGLNSEIAVTINNQVFVKGLRADHPRAWTQQRERDINPHIAHVSAPLAWSSVADGWDLNAFQLLEGHPADYRPDSLDLPTIAAMMAALPAAPAGLELKRAEQRWSSYSNRPELFEGQHLAHTDWSPSNVLVTIATARLVDWAWPTIGAAWLDPACWIVWLIAHGHTPHEAEHQAARVPAYRTALPDAITEFAKAQAAMWADIADSSPHPGLATAAADWVKHRTS